MDAQQQAPKLLSSAMLSQFERDRPSLPVISLTTDTAAITAMPIAITLMMFLPKQLRALGPKRRYIGGIQTTTIQLYRQKQLPQLTIRYISYSVTVIMAHDCTVTLWNRYRNSAYRQIQTHAFRKFIYWLPLFVRLNWPSIIRLTLADILLVKSMKKFFLLLVVLNSLWWAMLNHCNRRRGK